jgi:hypothetical protein
MKPSTIRRELLLFKSTSFASRQFGIECYSNLEPRVADFRGVAEHNRQTDILRALFQSSNKEAVAKEKLFIWQVDKFSSFIHLSVGDSPLCRDKHASVDPYFFWPTINLN